MKRKQVFSWLIILLLLVFVNLGVIGCGSAGSGGGGDYDPTSITSPTPTPTSTAAVGLYPEDRPQKEWTFLVYMCADNNLDGYGYLDMKEMETIGSTDDVYVVLQFDRSGDSSEASWVGCRRYYITDGRSRDVSSGKRWGTSGDSTSGETINSVLMYDMGDVNMGATSTLSDFVEFGVNNYPAKKYAVILWNHGNGWRKTRSGNELVKSICFDDTSNDELTIQEVRQGFATAASATGVSQIDVIGMDACLMNLAEVAYEIKDYGKYMVASQASEPGEGWPYHTILQDLTGSPTMTGSQLGKSIVTRYGEYYASDSSTTQSSIDLSKMGELATVLSSFADVAINEIGTEKSALEQAVQDTQSFDSYYSDYKDLGDFADQADSQVSSPAVRAAAQALRAKVDEVVVDEYHGSDFPRASGISIWLPSSSTYSSYKSVYATIQLSLNTTWDEFLEALLQ